MEVRGYSKRHRMKVNPIGQMELDMWSGISNWFVKTR